MRIKPFPHTSGNHGIDIGRLNDALRLLHKMSLEKRGWRWNHRWLHSSLVVRREAADMLRRLHYWGAEKPEGTRYVGDPEEAPWRD